MHRTVTAHTNVYCITVHTVLTVYSVKGRDDGIWWLYRSRSDYNVQSVKPGSSSNNRSIQYIEGEKEQKSPAPPSNQTSQLHSSHTIFSILFPVNYTQENSALVANYLQKLEIFKGCCNVAMYSKSWSRI